MVCVPAVLEVRDLQQSFGEHRVLHDVSFDVHAGECVAVVGPNGAGKTTLLRAVTGARPADGGTVLLHGRPLDERDPDVRRAMAVVMDDIDNFPDLSVVEHLDLLARAHGVVDAEELVDTVTAEVGLTHLGGRLPGTLSSGQRRRLSLASALVRPRSLLVLDEPEQRLDVAGVEWLGDRLLAEKAEGTAVLVVSHDPRLVERVSDRRVELVGT
ncbi:MAG: ATP-binding cassette domain-containing protein [Nocardioides sp.]|uniref:ABC transporter ATP-binding protein n=1 Tax=Nocardioides sp. TaxID=35761 RepID=UPI003F0CADBA